jgi:hypothetical protein
MIPEEFIAEAIRKGSEQGIAVLDADQRLVFLIAEAEVLCDMEGIDSFLRPYAPNHVQECADSFREVGAVKIAASLDSIAAGQASDQDLTNLNALIVERADYSFDAIAEVIRHRLMRRES